MYIQHIATTIRVSLNAQITHQLEIPLNNYNECNMLAFDSYRQRPLFSFRIKTCLILFFQDMIGIC